MSFNNNYVDEDLCKTEIEEHCNININETPNINVCDSQNKLDEDISFHVSDKLKHHLKQDENLSLDAKDISKEYLNTEKDLSENDSEGFKINTDLVSENSDTNDNVVNYEEATSFGNEETKTVLDKLSHDVMHIENVQNHSNVTTKPEIDVTKLTEIITDKNITNDQDVDLLIKSDNNSITESEYLRSTDNVPSNSSTKIESTEMDSTDGVVKESPNNNVKDSNTPTNDPDNYIDILGNNLLTKRVLVKGLGRETRPTHGDSVTIEYKAWNSSDNLFEQATETFVIGDGDMVQAFDLALCLAEMHEEFELKTDARFAYGSRGMLPDVQPNESLKYHIKLLSCEEAPDYTTYSYSDRMSAADKKRERGNYLYRREEFSYAVNSYSRAIKIIETDPDFKKSYNDESKADMFDLFVKVTNNLAASQLKLESYESVIETCNTILNFDPSNVKALFRKGKGLVAKGNYDEALMILRRAFELDNKNKLIANEIQKCQQLKRHEDEKSARFCRRIFGGSDYKKESGDNDVTHSSDAGHGWKGLLYKYSPYIGAILVTGMSIFLATVAISKSKTA